jgi:hypothetical protein
LSAVAGVAASACSAAMAAGSTPGELLADRSPDVEVNR